MISESMSKLDQSPVTVADFASQAVVGRMLEDLFPGEVLVAEEDSTALKVSEGAGTLRSVTEYVSKLFPQATTDQVCAWIDKGMGDPEGRFWVLDPIDGTKNFVSGSLLFGTLIALLHHGRPILGVIHHPLLDEFLVGTEGQTWLNGQNVSVRACSRIEDATLLVTSHWTVHHHQNGAAFDALSRRVRLYRPWGDCHGYYLVATGGADIMIDPVMSLWDAMALIPIIVVIAFIFVGIFSFLLRRTRFGRHTYAIGGSIDAALRSGINVVSHLTRIYMISSFFASLSGVLYVLKYVTGRADAGSARMLDAVVAVVIGGASLYGGTGTVKGTIIGALIIATLETGMVNLSIPYHNRYIVIGGILVFAVVIDQFFPELIGRRE